jgi:integrase
MSKPQKTQETESDWVKIGPCLYRYRKGNYYALVRFKGKQIRQSLDTDDLEMARRKLKKFRSDLETTKPSESRRTIAMQSELFLSGLVGEPTTKDNATRSIRNLVEHFGADTLVRKITPSECRAWIATFDLSADSKNKRIQHGRQFFQAAVDDQVIPSNPMSGIKYFSRAEPTRLTPSDEQFCAIVADLRAQVWNGHGRNDTADFVELAARLGLGQAELSGIQRQHINLEAGEIVILRKKTKQGFTIPIYPEARPIIERRLETMTEGPEQRLLPQDDCKKGLAAACKRLGFPNFEPRSLRRYFITKALRIGVDVPTIARWQGHRDGGVLIMSVYGDIVRMDHSQKMAALLTPKPTGENVVSFEKEAVA